MDQAVTVQSPPTVAEYPGDQRHSLERLRRWQELGYGLFIHFGMTTFTGDEFAQESAPPHRYQPSQLDVDQWVQAARDAGMRYAVLTAKHVSGFCLWPSDHTNYHVGYSPVKTDVVDAFVEACRRHGLKPGLYYCSADVHHRFGSRLALASNHPGGHDGYTTEEYRDFQRRQVEELLTRYGPLEEVWIDGPYHLGHDGRLKQYKQIAELQPDALVMMNQGFGDGSAVREGAWPTDLMALERWLPNSNGGYHPWHQISETARLVPKDNRWRDVGGAAARTLVPDPPRHYYLPGEVCDPIGLQWFHHDNDRLRSDQELLGMRLICQARNVNLLLNVPPDRTGRLPGVCVEALHRVARLYDNVGL